MSDERRTTNDERPTAAGDDRSVTYHLSPVTSDCHLSPSSSGCATCSDEALPARVLRVDPASGLALVALADTTIEVDISLVDEAAPGDLLLIHAGTAIAKL